jgi:hypothetical protein
MNYIQECIRLKNISGRPYQSYANDVTHVITDIDHFPYTRFYRGVYNDTNPHIWEREAGYHVLQSQGYQKHLSYEVPEFSLPMQIPCSTIIPPKSCGSLCNQKGCVNKSP